MWWLFRLYSTLISACVPSFAPPCAFSARQSCFTMARQGRDSYILADSYRQISRSFMQCYTQKPGSKLPATILRPRTFRAVEPAAPRVMVSMVCTRSSPDLLAYMRPYTVPAMLPARMIWLTILVCCPWPAPPAKFMARLYFSIIGLIFSSSSFSPPHMTTSLPSLAPTSPPETGASMLPMPRALASLKMLTARLGRLVVWSTSSDPFFICFRMPFSPSTMVSTSLGKPSIRKSTSTLLAISCGDNHSAPSSMRGCAFSAVLLYTEREKCALSRCLHMLSPMTPVPIHPIFILNQISINK